MTEKPGEDDYKCSLCKDKGWIIERKTEIDPTTKEPKINRYGKVVSVDVASECSCRTQQNLVSRFKSAMIPNEFENARFDNYEQITDVQIALYTSVVDYLKNFLTNFNKSTNTYKGNCNLGFIAEFGEQRIRGLDTSIRAQTKQENNSFGLGKTHLQVAAAKWLMRNGITTLIVSDVAFLDELIQEKLQNETKLLNKAMNVNVLIWDDIGKSKPSEAKDSIYYNIINERYKNNRPIIFSSNEDRGTLSERIGYASASRLLGMCEVAYLIECKGEDYRLKKKVGAS